MLVEGRSCGHNGDEVAIWHGFVPRICTSETSVHQSGMGVSEDVLCWVIWVEMVILLMDLFSFHSLCFLRRLVILVSASMPNQRTRFPIDGGVPFLQPGHS